MLDTGAPMPGCMVHNGGSWWPK